MLYEVITKLRYDHTRTTKKMFMIIQVERWKSTPITAANHRVDARTTRNTKEISNNTVHRPPILYSTG